MMEEIKKVNDEALEDVAGGTGGFTGQWMTVRNITSGYLAIRTAPAFKYENEINHIGLYNGDQVQIAGPSVKGTGADGGPATYAYVFAPKFGCYGYVNEYFLG